MRYELVGVGKEESGESWEAWSGPRKVAGLAQWGTRVGAERHAGEGKERELSEDAMEELERVAYG